MRRLLSHIVAATCSLFLGNRALSCDEAVFTPADQIELPQTELLIVTHPSTIWDPRASAKAGVDFVTRRAVRHDQPVVELRHAVGDTTYYAANCRPTYFARSESGEIAFQFAARHVELTGGQFHQCFRKTFRDVSQRLAAAAARADARIDIFAEGVYATFFYVPQSAMADISRFLRVYGGSPTSSPVYMTLGQLLRTLSTPEARLELLVKFLEDEQFFATVDPAVWQVFQMRLVLDRRYERTLKPGPDKATLAVHVTSEFPSPF